MTRLLSTLGWDARLQFRNGFYYAAAVVAVIWTLLLLRLPRDVYPIVMPGFVFENLIINTFYFIAGLVLLEKGEGTLEAIVVTPLRRSEYLASKVATLTGLSLVENLVIILLVVGREFRPLPLLAGMILMAAMYALFGFIAIARYDTINEYLFPSFLMTAALSLPLFELFGIWHSPLSYLHPLQAPLVLVQAAFGPAPGWQLVYGVLYALAWLVVLAYASLRAFDRFVVRKEGVKG